MRIVFLTHPPFLGSQSMPRFAQMLTNGMQQRGHQAETWTPEAKFYKLPVPGSLKKWMGYIDQYLVFPAQVRKRLKKYPADTLFVFTDHALGPWVPLVASRAHVIHCHDFLAQQSALGHIEENPVSKTGKQYQAYIKAGYQKGKNFVSVSQKTQQDLHQILGYVPPFSKVVYNGLNQQFAFGNVSAARALINKDTGIDTINGYLLHVGGNQWYKNRVGVIDIYNAWRRSSKTVLPLLMLGVAANDKLKQQYQSSPYKDDIHLLSGKDDAFIRTAYQGATLMLFPSLAEGFGWPIAEAMASGCPVITTGLAPMTEVGGDAAFYIPRRPGNTAEQINWAEDAAQVADKLINSSLEKRESIVAAGLLNASRFDAVKSLDDIESIYKEILTTV